MPSPVAAAAVTLDATALDTLERGARAATPGPWQVRRHPVLPSFVQAPRTSPSDPYDIEVLGEDKTLYPTREQDVEHVAACSPDVMIALIALARIGMATLARMEARGVHDGVALLRCTACGDEVECGLIEPGMTHHCGPVDGRFLLVPRTP